MYVLQAVLCRIEQTESGDESCVTLALSKEHNPTIYEERMRIQRAGGTVRSVCVCVPGVWWTCISGDLLFNFTEIPEEYRISQ